MRSMTGFGRGQGALGDVLVTCEIKTLNHKGLDPKMRLPREASGLEQQVLSRVKSLVERGRVDLVVELGSAVVSRFDDAGAAELLAQAREAARRAGVVGEFTSGDVLTALLAVQRRDGPSISGGAVEGPVLRAVDDALRQLLESRDAEGRALTLLLDARVQAIDALRAQIEVRTADAPVRLAERLHARLRAALASGERLELDAARVAQEVALLADRVDVTEELERLAAHVQQTRLLMAAASPGRKLEFLCQELLREANTLGSKCQDAPTAHLVVELKSEIERLREQVQNVE